jgi:uncharacterized integral membrane protein
MKGIFRFITFLLFVGIVLLAFLFAVNNPVEVSLWLGFELPAISVGKLIIYVFILGGVLGLVIGLGIFRQLKYKIQIRQLRSSLEKLRSSDGNSSHQNGK